MESVIYNNVYIINPRCSEDVEEIVECAEEHSIELLGNIPMKTTVIHVDNKEPLKMQYFIDNYLVNYDNLILEELLECYYKYKNEENS